MQCSKSQTPPFLRFCSLPSPVHSDVIAVDYGQLQRTSPWGKRRAHQVWSANCVNWQSYTELNWLKLYATWRCGAATLVIPERATCLHVGAQSCNYRFPCKKAEALMSARWGSSGFARLVCLLQNPSFRFTVNCLAASPLPLIPVSVEATLPLRAEGV